MVGVVGLVLAGLTFLFGSDVLRSSSDAGSGHAPSGTQRGEPGQSPTSGQGSDAKAGSVLAQCRDVSLAAFYGVNFTSGCPAAQKAAYWPQDNLLYWYGQLGSNHAIALIRSTPTYLACTASSVVWTDMLPADASSDGSDICVRGDGIIAGVKVRKQGSSAGTDFVNIDYTVWTSA